MTLSTNNISIVGAPFNGGQPKPGVEKAPKALREAGLLTTLTGFGWKVAHDSDVAVKEPPKDDTFPGAKRPRYVGAVCNDLFNAVESRAKAGDFVLTIGGDHSIAAGSIAGILSARPDTFVVWVDAHADINTPATSESGNIHGMPVALLAHLCGQIPGFEYLEKAPALNLENIAYIGLRDVDSGEQKLIAEKNITAYFMKDVQELGIKHIMEKVLERAGNRPIHLSFDVDGVDPKYMPATGTAVGGGLSLEDAVYICKQIANTKRVHSFDLVEINLDLSDEQGKLATRSNSLALVEGLLSTPL